MFKSTHEPAFLLVAVEPFLLAAVRVVGVVFGTDGRFSGAPFSGVFRQNRIHTFIKAPL